MSGFQKLSSPLISVLIPTRPCGRLTNGQNRRVRNSPSATLFQMNANGLPLSRRVSQRSAAAACWAALRGQPASRSSRAAPETSRERDGTPEEKDDVGNPRSRATDGEYRLQVGAARVERGHCAPGVGRRRKRVLVNDAVHDLIGGREGPGPLAALRTGQGLRKKDAVDTIASGGVYGGPEPEQAHRERNHREQPDEAQHHGGLPTPEPASMPRPAHCMTLNRRGKSGLHLP